MRNHILKHQLMAACLLAASALGPAAYAVDGVFEISSACAAFGCFPGDSSSFPVTITQPGSYRLTSNLSTNNANTTLIIVTADNVSIDLNGFSLLGPVICSGVATISCSTSGSGVGIEAGNVADSVDNLIVRNGMVNGMGDIGIIVSSNALLEQLVVTSNADAGVAFIESLSVSAVSGGGLGRELSLSLNGGGGAVSRGFTGSTRNYIMDSTVVRNGGRGLSGLFCSNVLMSGNDDGNDCTAIAPNQCSPATDCD